MKTIADVMWGDFLIEDLFEIRNGVRLVKSDMTNGKTPFIGATDSNNGITSFCNETNKSYDANVLGVNYNGSVVENFYHPYGAIFSDDVKRLKLKFHDGNKYIYLFIKRMILQQKVKYEYGYKFNSERMRRQIIRLPITNNGQPDYAFMEEFMKSIERQLLENYRNTINKAIDPSVFLRTEAVQWRAYPIAEIFSITSTNSGIDKKRLNGRAGSYPYVTRSDKRNGQDSYIGKQPSYKLNDGNVISIGLDTQTVFYQPYPFYTGQNIQILKNNNCNKYSYLYLIPLLKKQMVRFNWGGNGATIGRLKKSMIILPINQLGHPNYAYMEACMRKMETDLIIKYLEYKNNKE